MPVGRRWRRLDGGGGGAGCDRGGAGAGARGARVGAGLDRSLDCVASAFSRRSAGARLSARRTASRSS
eukprot:scaffold46200_cov66-Phaeocystis_antarctica.AAC.5